MSDNKKLPKIKHNHTLTDILKASIFSLVMMAPVTAIGVTCAYVVCNKNAYQSYSDDSKVLEQNITLNNLDEIVSNYSYFFEFKENTNNNTKATYRLGFKNLNINNEIVYNDGYFTWGAAIGYADGYFLCIYDTSLNYITRYNLNNYLGTYQIFITEVNKTNPSYYYNTLFGNNVIYPSLIVQANTLDNVFYYAVDTMQNNTLFSWTKTTAIYTPVNAMTTGMGINTPAIAVLLVYWLLCTAVYIIIDIVVKGFTWLTHLIGER